LDFVREKAFENMKKMVEENRDKIPNTITKTSLGRVEMPHEY